MREKVLYKWKEKGKMEDFRKQVLISRMAVILHLLKPASASTWLDIFSVSNFSIYSLITFQSPRHSLSTIDAIIMSVLILKMFSFAQEILHKWKQRTYTSCFGTSDLRPRHRAAKNGETLRCSTYRNCSHRRNKQRIKQNFPNIILLLYYNSKFLWLMLSFYCAERKQPIANLGQQFSNWLSSLELLTAPLITANSNWLWWMSS